MKNVPTSPRTAKRIRFEVGENVLLTADVRRLRDTLIRDVPHDKTARIERISFDQDSMKYTVKVRVYDARFVLLLRDVIKIS